MKRRDEDEDENEESAEDDDDLSREAEPFYAPSKTRQKPLDGSLPCYRSKQQVGLSKENYCAQERMEATRQQRCRGF